MTAIEFKPSALSPEERLRVYELLYLFNAAMHNCVTLINQAAEEFKKQLGHERMMQILEITKESQSAYNACLLENFLPLERGDYDMFGRVRKAREQYWEQMNQKPDTPNGLDERTQP